MSQSSTRALRLVSSPDPVDSARAAGLRYTTDGRPGIRRRRRGLSAFTYMSAAGRHRSRPGGTPADPRAGHPACVAGRVDLSGRPGTSAGDRTGRSRPQAASLSPALASGPRRDEVSPHDRLCAGAGSDSASRPPPTSVTRVCRARRCSRAVVQLLEKTLIRVGNDEYARQNRSFGLTTLRDGHVEISGGARDVLVPRQERSRARGRSRRSPSRADRQSVPRPARLRPVSVRRRRRHAGRRSVRRT